MKKQIAKKKRKTHTHRHPRTRTTRKMIKRNDGKKKNLPEVDG